jgi:hypothetical protein
VKECFNRREPGEVYRTIFVALLTGILSFIAGALVQRWLS